MASIAFLTAGIALLVLVLVDVFVTILSLRGAGPLNSRISGFVWKGLLKFHYRNNISRLLTLAGPTMMIGTILGWYILINISWLLIFLSNSNSVIVNSLATSTDLMQKFYFVGSSLSTSSYGDLVPSKFPWTFFSNVSTFSATFVITISLSYVISVVGAAVKRKEIAETIYFQAETVEDFLMLASTSKDLDFFFQSISQSLQRNALNHLIYPVLHYFHNPEKSSSRGVLVLSDGIFLLGQAKDKLMSRSSRNAMEGAIKTYARLKKKNTVELKDSDLWDVKHLSPSTLERFKIYPVPEGKFRADLKRYLEIRSKLVQICIDDGWG